MGHPSLILALPFSIQWASWPGWPCAAVPGYTQQQSNNVHNAHSRRWISHSCAASDCWVLPLNSETNETAISPPPYCSNTLALTCLIKFKSRESISAKSPVLPRDRDNYRGGGGNAIWCYPEILVSIYISWYTLTIRRADLMDYGNAKIKWNASQELKSLIVTVVFEGFYKKKSSTFEGSEQVLNLLLQRCQFDFVIK